MNVNIDFRRWFMKSISCSFHYQLRSLHLEWKQEAKWTTMCWTINWPSQACCYSSKWLLGDVVLCCNICPASSLSASPFDANCANREQRNCASGRERCRRHVWCWWGVWLWGGHMVSLEHQVNRSRGGRTCTCTIQTETQERKENRQGIHLAGRNPGKIKAREEVKQKSAKQN